MDKRFNANLVWVAALLAVVACIGVEKAAITHSTKVFSTICFIIFGGLAAASTMFTEVKKGTAILAFAAGAVVWGIVVYILLHPMVAAAETTAKAFAYTWTAVWFIDALAAGIAGAIFGRKLQGQLGQQGAKSPVR
jgi:hypothetical protein